MSTKHRFVEPMRPAKQQNQNRRKSTNQDEDYDGSVGNVSHTKVFIVVLTISALVVAIYIQLTKNLHETWRLQQKQQMKNMRQDLQYHSMTGTNTASNTLIIADHLDKGYLDHVIDSLLKFGHKLSFSGSAMTEKKVATDLEEFDTIWTHDYPFQTLKKLQPIQRINHFPGTGFITNKLMLSTTPKIPHLLKAFRLPSDKEKFSSYVNKNPEKKWILKTSGHRGISIESADSILGRLTQLQEANPRSGSTSDTEMLVQEFMQNPLLIDGKKFDIGIYAVLTSVEPLRVYIYDAESLIRFCARPYLDKQTNQFNASDMDSYVVGDDYTPIWLMPSLLRYYIGTNLSMKQTINSYLKQFGKDGLIIWEQIEETISWVYKTKEQHLARMQRMYQQANNYNDTSIVGSLNQFFEMVRFDFIIDDQLQVYLMEANMSPNLSSQHFPPNRLLYEQVLQSYFSLVGLDQFAQAQLSSARLPIHYLDGRVDMPKSNVKIGADQRYGLDSIISEKELSVYEDLCVSDECHMNCQKLDCRTCYFCLNNSDKLHLRRAVFEHLSKWNFKRLLPSTRDEMLEMQLSQHEPGGATGGARGNQVDANYIHVQWFRGKCYNDHRYCST